MSDGETEHQDSTGGGGLITNGDTQWMTAGAGILHIERPPEHLVRSGGVFHGVQLWVNLPAAKKFVPPRYQDIPASRVALVASFDGGALVRIIAGNIDGHEGPGVTHTPIALAHASLASGARLEVPWPPSYNALVYVLSGHGFVGPERRPIRMGQLAVFRSGDYVRVDGGSAPLEVLLLGGQPIGERVVPYGPFVMNSDQEIRQAIADYQAGRMGVIPATSSSAP
jgi:redox-sensitive bicupin YhaK (pirin superfamily)